MIDGKAGQIESAGICGKLKHDHDGTSTGSQWNHVGKTCSLHLAATSFVFLTFG